MHLVEPEEVGPIEGDDPRVTPPRPPHRRVSVSLLFTLSVLIGLVVTIYLVLPAHHNALLEAAIEKHREPGEGWDLEKPNAGELRAWAIGVVGKDPPLPDAASVVGAKRVEVANRDAAMMRLSIGGEDVTYIVQKGRGIVPKHSEKQDGELQAKSWRCGKFMCVAVGHQSSAGSWLAAFEKK